METLIKADIFFFVTTIFVVVLIVFFIIIGLYLVKAMKNFASISDTLKKGVDNADEEIRDIVEQVKDSPVFSFIFGKSRKKKK